MVMPARPRNGPGKTKSRAKSYRFSRLPGPPRGAPFKTLGPSWRTLLSVPRSHSCERLFPPALCSQECEHGTHECVRYKASSLPLESRRPMVTPLRLLPPQRYRRRDPRRPIRRQQARQQRDKCKQQRNIARLHAEQQSSEQPGNAQHGQLQPLAQHQIFGGTRISQEQVRRGLLLSGKKGNYSSLWHPGSVVFVYRARSPDSHCRTLRTSG
jgi:hypothetical protein